MEEIIDDSHLFDEPFSITEKKGDNEGMNNSLIFGEIESFTQEPYNPANKIAIGGIDEVGKIKPIYKTPQRTKNIEKMPLTLMSHLGDD